MNFYALALLGGAGAALLAFNRTAKADTMNAPTADFQEIYEKYGVLYGVDPLLLRAHAVVESRERPDAVRNNPPRDVSVGLMQILCLPSADGSGRCANSFNVEGWEGITFDALKDADKNVMIGAQILGWNLREFGFPRGIAVYNSWSARLAPLAGPFPNQSYVDKVLAQYRALVLKGA